MVCLLEHLRFKKLCFPWFNMVTQGEMSWISQKFWPKFETGKTISPLYLTRTTLPNQRFLVMANSFHPSPSLRPVSFILHVLSEVSDFRSACHAYSLLNLLGEEVFWYHLRTNNERINILWISCSRESKRARWLRGECESRELVCVRILSEEALILPCSPLSKLLFSYSLNRLNCWGLAKYRKNI